MEYELKESSISVPKNTGLPGFLHAIKKILSLPRIQELSVDAKGTIVYKRYVALTVEEDFPIFFDALQPWASVRQGEVEELFLPRHNAANVLVQLFDVVASYDLKPTMFIVSDESVIWDWYQITTKSKIKNQSTLCGLPVLVDRELPPTALILCAAFEANTDLASTQRAFKVEIDKMGLPPEVDIL